MYGGVPASTLTGGPELAGTAEAPLPPTGEAPGRASPKSSSFAPDPREHHVGRLEVAVHDAGSMRGHQRLGDVDGNAEGRVDRKGPAPEARRQRLAVDQFHHQVGCVPLTDPGRPDVVQRADARMGEPRDCARLALEALAAVVSDARREHLDGDVPIQARVARPVDLTHPTRSEQAEHFEGAEPIARAQVRRGGRIAPGAAGVLRKPSAAG